MAAINTPREFVEHIQGAPAFDLAGVEPWERETLSPYLGYPKDWPTGKIAAPRLAAGAQAEAAAIGILQP
jgi:hypothetical protein